MDDLPKEPRSNFKLKFELEIWRRNVLLPWLVVCIALIGSSAFWRIVERLLVGVS